MRYCERRGDQQGKPREERKKGTNSRELALELALDLGVVVPKSEEDLEKTTGLDGLEGASSCER